MSEKTPGGAPTKASHLDGARLMELSAYATFATSLKFYDNRGALAEALTSIVGEGAEIDVDEAEIQLSGERLISVEPTALFVQSRYGGADHDEREFVKESLGVVGDVLKIDTYELMGVGVEAIVPAADGMDPTAALDRQFGIADPHVLSDVFDNPLHLEKHAFQVQEAGLLFKIELEAMSRADVVGHANLRGEPSDYPDRFVFVNLKALGVPDMEDFDRHGEVGAMVFDRVHEVLDGLAGSLELSDGD
jgi:hypothetical protein